MTAPLFDVEVQLVGENGNAMAIMGRVARALKRAGASESQIAQYHRESMSGDYDHLVQTAMRWVNVT